MTHSQLLISIPNVASSPRPSCLLSMDVLTQRMEWIDVGFGQPLASGVGIQADERFVYHVSIANADFSTQLAVLDRESLQVVHTQRLAEVVDGHSVARLGDELCVVSTGTDEIVAYRLDGPKATDARTLWAPTASGTDTHHINSIVVHDGELWCSAFGPKDSERYSWATVANGYIRNVTRETTHVEGLQQPHSAIWHDGELYFCNSRPGTVNTTEGLFAHLYGYSRGLAFAPDGSWYAGTSLGRRPAHDPARTDEFGSLVDRGEVHGRCAVVQFSPGGTRTEIGLGQHGHEIYDFLLL